MLRRERFSRAFVGNVSMLGANFKKSVSRITNWGHESPRRESKQGCSWLLSSCLERISSLIWELNQRRAQSWGVGSWAQHVHFGQVEWAPEGEPRARSLPGLHPQPPTPGTGGRGHRLPASRPGAAAASGDGGWAHARQGLCWTSFASAAGQEKAARPRQARGPRWGTR